MATASGLAAATYERLGSLQDRMNVFDGYAPTGAGETYTVFYPGSGAATSNRQSSTFDTFDWGCYLICAGRTRMQVLVAVDLVRSVLLGFSPDPSPAAGFLEESDLGSSMQRDPDNGLFFLTLRYALTTNRS
jgi:hypothetical protein